MASTKKKWILGFIISAGFIAALVILGFFLIVSGLWKSPSFNFDQIASPEDVSLRSVYLPANLPSGFTPVRGTTSLMISSDESISQEYQAASRRRFLFEYLNHQSFSCHLPTSNATPTSDYRTFALADGTQVCAVTIISGSYRNRTYDWVRNDIHFTVIAENLSITDNQLLNMANSITLQTVKVTQLHTVPINK